MQIDSTEHKRYTCYKNLEIISKLDQRWQNLFPKKKKISVNWVKGPHLQYKFSLTPVVNTQNACFQNNNFSYLKNFE